MALFGYVLVFIIAKLQAISKMALWVLANVSLSIITAKGNFSKEIIAILLS